MPVARDSYGRATYVNSEELFANRPEDFFRHNPEEFQKRVDRARGRVLEAIRFASTPLTGRGLCHEVHFKDIIGDGIEQLVDYVDRADGRRALQVRRQAKRRSRKSRIAPPPYRLRSPQDIKRRRSALFGGKDIPSGYFDQNVSQATVDRVVDLMRWYLIEEAILAMYYQHELELVGCTWYVPVSVMDGHRLSRRAAPRSGDRVKHDDRSFHGRPNRDRRTLAA